MISAILGLLTGVIQFFASVLPASPLADLASGSQSISTAIGWLNWLVPVGDFLLLFGAYLAAMLIWAGVEWFMKSGGRVLGGLVGGK